MISTAIGILVLALLIAGRVWWSKVNCLTLDTSGEDWSDEPDPDQRSQAYKGR